MNITSFIDWQADNPDRRVDIEIRNSGEVRIWVSETGAGQYVQSVSEIDIDRQREKRDRAEQIRLNMKYPLKGEAA